jgi:hypothetical protein
MKQPLIALAIVTALAAAAAPAPELPDHVYQHAGDTVRLQQVVCTNVAVLQRVHPVLQPRLRAAVGIMAGQTFQGCWILRDGVVQLQWEDGDIGQLDWAVFRHEPGA